MRRWGLYVSNPLGPEESVTPFAGEEWHLSSSFFVVSCGLLTRGRSQEAACAAWVIEQEQLHQQECVRDPAQPYYASSNPDKFGPPGAEPAVFLVNPAGLVHVLVYSNCSFARPDLKQIVQGE